MCSKGIFKRVVPFLITLTVGLFIASFFVDLAPRPIGFRGGPRRQCRDFKELYMQEHDRAERLERELDRVRQNPSTLQLVHPQPWTAPDEYVPPPPVRSPRSGR